METIGIIAEYNPFHNGHLYQIQKIKEETKASFIVVIMSGDFVQRGAPAWIDKSFRTQLALSAGADLVFELPVCYATASAEYFALAGVSLLSSLGVADGICFGCEYNSLAPLKEIADFLVQPPQAFHDCIKELLAKGMSYPAARQKALEYCAEKETLPDLSLLSAPNTILAVEYLKALRILNSPLTPFSIQRTDAGYHHTDMPAVLQASASETKMSFASASAIRTILTDNTPEPTDKQNFFNLIKNVVPPSVYQLLIEQQNRFPVTENDFSDLLYYRLKYLSEKDRDIADMTPELFNRIQRSIADYKDYTSFVSLLKTKQYTYSRISRLLLHLLLNIRKNDLRPMPDISNKNAKNEVFPYLPYARLLGFSRKASPLLRCKPQIPIITKPADGLRQIQEFYADAPLQDIAFACRLYQKDITASDLYTQVQNTKLGLSLQKEYRKSPVIFP